MVDNFDFSPDPEAPDSYRAILVDPDNPAKGMRYQMPLLATSKTNPNVLFKAILNFIEFSYDKEGNPAFPPKSVRSDPHIESIALSEQKTK